MGSVHDKAVKTTWLSIAGNTILALVKGITGYFGNSYAMIADAIESASDVLASFLVLFGLKYANRPADANHPYGHGRAEPLVTFLVVGFLILSAAVIAYESIDHIYTPHVLPEPYTLYVLGAIILYKEIFYRFVIRRSKETRSTSLKADAWHHRSDALTSLAAFIGISVALVLGEGYETADDWAALIACVFILYNSYTILRPALSEIMDENLYQDVITEIKEKSMEVRGVVDTEKCYIRKSGLHYHVDLHIVVASHITVKEGHAIAHRLKDHLKAAIPQIADVLIHVEPDE